MQQSNLKWVIGISLFAGLITAIVLPAVSSAAPDTSAAKTKNPLQGMTPVEASKGLDLPQVMTRRR